VVAAVAVAAVEPASVLALAVVVVVAEVEVAAEVVLALRSSDMPTRRKVARYRLPQALRSICRYLDWCPLRLLPKLHRS
jgi:hypothetical protein